MKSLARLCALVVVFCAVPISSPPIARGSAGAPVVEARRKLPSPAAARARSEPALPTPYEGVPPVTRLQILDIARSAVGKPYVHGGESWASESSMRGGTDCSGLIAKAWQVPGAAEPWDALAVRPTTATLREPAKDWFQLPISERRPGDVLVRFGALVRHAFIYERDDQEFGANGWIWVYEAAQPSVQHRRYRLTDLRAYTLTRRRGLDDVGLVGRSRHAFFPDLIAAFLASGGERFLGTPYDRGDGVLVHTFATQDDAGVSQDFHGGSLGESCLVRGQRQRGVFVLSGAELIAHRGRSIRARFLLRQAP